MSRQKSNIFYKAKGVMADGHTPLCGEPNTNLDIYGKRDGRLKTRRKFDSRGFAYKDYDTGHGHNPKSHVHKFNEDGSRNTKPEEPSKKERREINKARRKRRNYND